MADYFADYSSVSQSMMKVFADRRGLFDAYYVSQRLKPKPPTDPMRKGTALHTALLEPERFHSLVVPYPDGYLSEDGGCRSKEAKAWKAEQEAASRVPMKPTKGSKPGDLGFADVEAMRNSLLGVLADWLDSPDVLREQAIYWHDDGSGQPCKARLDIAIPGRIIFDVKTCADASPDGFRKAILTNGYGRQAAHYIDAANGTWGGTHEFVFVCVENAEPYSVALHRIKPDDLAAFDRRRREELQAIADCYAANDWREPWEFGKVDGDFNEVQFTKWELERI